MLWPFVVYSGAHIDLPAQKSVGIGSEFRDRGDGEKGENGRSKDGRKEGKKEGKKVGRREKGCKEENPKE